MRAHLRVARPTDHLAAVVDFYRDGLGLEVLGEFQDLGALSRRDPSRT